MTHPERFVLAGVPKIQYFTAAPGRCPESIAAPAVMRALAEALGENIGCISPVKGRSWGLGCGYGYFMGAMGASAMAWAPGCPGDQPTFSFLPGDPLDPYRRAFAAAGYSFKALNKESGEAAYREEIFASIYTRQQPLIAFGVVGPLEPLLVTGYDEGGDVLIGWSFYQGQAPYNAGLEYEENGCFRKRGWFETAGNLIAAGERLGRPDSGKILAGALRWNLEVARTNQVRGIPAGTAAYNRWVDFLLDDGQFANKDDAALVRLHDLHNMTTGWVAEVRWYGSVWLVNTYRGQPYRLSEPLLKAAAAWAAEHHLMWELWDSLGGIEEPDWRLFCQPSTRRRLADLVRQSRAKYIEAAAQIEEAVQRL